MIPKLLHELDDKLNGSHDARRQMLMRIVAANGRWLARKNLRGVHAAVLAV